MTKQYAPRHLTVSSGKRRYTQRLYNHQRGHAKKPRAEPVQTAEDRIRELKRMAPWDRSKLVRLPELKFLNPDKEDTL